MIHVKNLSDEEAARAIQAGEFPETVIRSSKRVAIVLTQGWCPQWLFMRRWIKDGNEANTEVTVYTYTYDESPLFENFLAFKEDVLGNDQIPYLRYYRDGVCVASSNYVTQARFFELLG